MNRNLKIFIGIFLIFLGIVTSIATGGIPAVTKYILSLGSISICCLYSTLKRHNNHTI